MKYIKFDKAEEMTKVAQGKRTKLPVEMALYFGLDHHPTTQKKVAKAFGIT